MIACGEYIVGQSEQSILNPNIIGCCYSVTVSPKSDDLYDPFLDKMCITSGSSFEPNMPREQTV